VSPPIGPLSREVFVQRVDGDCAPEGAGVGEHMNAGTAAWEEVLKKAKFRNADLPGCRCTTCLHNDTAPARYNEHAAMLVWNRAVAL